MNGLSERMITIGDRKVGIVGLDEALDDLTSNGHQGCVDPGRLLLEAISHHNYVPEGAQGEYAIALALEYERYICAPTAGGSRGSGNLRPATWRGRPREEVGWFPVIAPDLCDNCADCLGFCEFGVFAYHGPSGGVLVAEPYNCVVGCSACEKVCPRGAIRFPPRSVLASGGGSRAIA